MSRIIHRLKPLNVEREKQPGRHSDGGGLYLNVSKSGSKSWLFMWSKQTGYDPETNKRHVKRYEMGLGGFPAVTLAKARDRAQECRALVQDGLNPLEEKRKNVVKSFGDAADEYIDSVRSEWSNEKHEYQWRHTLGTYCSPIRLVPIADVTTEDVLRILKPMWQDKHETAARTRSRIERVIDYATAKGWRVGDNPARWRGHLKNILPGKKRGEKKNLPAMHYKNVPAFIERLRARDAVTARALEFTILTASRSSEALHAKWDEIDWEEAIWIVPAERMKLRKEHRVPLTDRCMEILRGLWELRSSEFIFPGQKPGRPISSMGMNMLLRRMEIKDATTHGFRSSFRDWAGDRTTFSREVAEMALSHKVGDEVEQAYRRMDALEKRRQLAEAWGDYCSGTDTGKVVSLHG